jgi:hypothetical protein
MRLWQVAVLAGMAAAPLQAKDRARPFGNLKSDAIEMPPSTTIRQYDQWRIEQSSAFVAALTNNPAGSLFGLLCGTTCSYYVNVGRTCDVGATYPGLLSGANGALAVTLRCLHVNEEGDEYAVLLIDEDVTDALGDAADVSIVVPVAGGQFSVARFSMAGAAEAMDDMLDMVDEKPNPGNFTL